MRNLKSKLLLIALLVPLSGFCSMESTTSVGEAKDTRYLQVTVDNLVIDTKGLVTASQSLAQSIDRLSVSIEKIAINNDTLDSKERAMLMQALTSVDKASTALSELAQQLPVSTQQLSTKLPQIVNDAKEPIAELSSGLRAASDSVLVITESLPKATENAKALVDASLDSALIKFSTYTILLIATLALALIGVIWFVYRQYLAPLTQKLDELTGAPQHLVDMSRYMKETSDNLVALQEIHEVQRINHEKDAEIDKVENEAARLD